MTAWSLPRNRVGLCGFSDPPRLRAHMHLLAMVIGAILGGAAFFVLAIRLEWNPIAGSAIGQVLGIALFGLAYRVATNGWLCVRGIHRWSASPPDGCGYDRSCRWCDARERQGLSHDWLSWTKNPETCVRSRTCGRCLGTERGGVQHAWSQERVEPCTIHQRCADCGQEEDLADHDWNDSSEPTESYCSTRTCRRCSATEYEQHDDPVVTCSPDSGIVSGSQMFGTCTHRCRRCGTVIHEHGVSLA